jgi:hypothetical protein
MDSLKQSQVAIYLEHPPICPLSLWERVRVRVVAARSCSFSVPA